MKVSDILIIMENKAAVLVGQRAEAVTAGDLEAVNVLDAQIVETQATVAQLQTLIPAPPAGE